MKWFEHESDTLENPKIKAVMKEFGAEGYLVCFGTWEKIAKYGDKNLRLSLEKYPKTLLCEDFGIKEDLLDKIWLCMTRKTLLCGNQLKNNILYSKGLKERCDEYHKKLLTKSRQSREKVGVDKNRIDKNRIDKIIDVLIERKGWDKNNKELVGSIYKRHCKPAKELLLLINNDEYAVRAVKWVADMCRNKGLNWTLETVIAWIPDYMVKYPFPNNTPEEIKKMVSGIGRSI